MMCISFSSPLGPKVGRLQAILLRGMGAHVTGPILFGRSIKIYAPEKLYLGNRVAIGDNSHIACHANIEIGDDFISAPGLYMNSGQHNIHTMHGFGEFIRIGDRVWCGVRVTICAGVEIGDDVVIGAGSVVVKNVPSNSMVVGVPAKVIGVVNRDLEKYERVGLADN